MKAIYTLQGVASSVVKGLDGIHSVCFNVSNAGGVEGHAPNVAIDGCAKNGEA